MTGREWPPRRESRRCTTSTTAEYIDTPASGSGSIVANRVRPNACLESLRIEGRLYVVGDDTACYRYQGGTQWERVGSFIRYGHPMGIHDGRLFVGLHNPASVQAYDGTQWKALPNPSPTPPDGTQTHAFDVYRGRLHVTTWPLGTVERLTDQDTWETLGRLGDALEINGLTVYNGKFYGGAIPRAEIFRYDEATAWTSVGRFLEPPDYQFQDSKEWARVTSLTVYGGKLFAGLAELHQFASGCTLRFPRQGVCHGGRAVRFLRPQSWVRAGNIWRR